MPDSDRAQEQTDEELLETPKVIREALDRQNVSWELLMGISLLTTPQDPQNTASREIGYRHLEEATELFAAKRKSEVGLFPPIGGVCLHGDGHFQWSFNLDRILFDWSEVWPMTYQIESLADEAREWWPEPEPGDEESPRRTQVWKRLVRFLKGSFVRVHRPSVARHPHSTRAFGLASWILAAMVLENKRHQSSANAAVPPPPTDAFRSDLTLYRQELRSAQKRFLAAAQRTAQSRYWQGAIVGTFAIAVLCVILGLVFWWRGTEAAYGVALPAGSLGAIVSVLQRMNSGKLVLDIDASRDMLEVFGAVRPFIGAVFGLAVTALLIGGLIPAIEIPDGQELAFLAGIGFLAGFNERWAQDILRTSSTQVGSVPSQEQGAEAAREAQTDSR